MPSLECLPYMFKLLMSQVDIINTKSSRLGCRELLRALVCKVEEALGEAEVYSDHTIQMVCRAIILHSQFTFGINIHPHFHVTLGSLWSREAKVKLDRQKRLENSAFCILPALHQRGS